MNYHKLKIVEDLEITNYYKNKEELYKNILTIIRKIKINTVLGDDNFIFNN